MAFPDEDIDQTVEFPEIEVEEGEENDGIDDLPVEETRAALSSKIEPLHAFGIHIEHEWDEGVRCAPRCGPAGTTQASWRVHGGKGTRIVTWEATAFAEWPKVPHPASLCPNDVLVSKKIVHGDPKPLLGNAFAYTIAGRYVYELLKAPGDDDILASARHPLSNIPAAVNTIRINQFDKTLLHALNPSGFVEPPGGLARLAGTGQS